MAAETWLQHSFENVLVGLRRTFGLAVKVLTRNDKSSHGRGSESRLGRMKHASLSSPGHGNPLSQKP